MFSYRIGWALVAFEPPLEVLLCIHASGMYSYIPNEAKNRHKQIFINDVILRNVENRFAYNLIGAKYAGRVWKWIDCRLS